MVNNTSSKASNSTEKLTGNNKILREILDNQGIESYAPIYKEKAFNILGLEKLPEEFSGENIHTEQLKTYDLFGGENISINQDQNNLEFTGNRQILRSFGLDEFDLGKPSSPDIELNPEVPDSKKPQARLKDGKWEYNWLGAITESVCLKKMLPTKAVFKEIRKYYQNKGTNLAGDFGLTNKTSNGLDFGLSYWSSDKALIDYFKSNPSRAASLQVNFGKISIVNSSTDEFYSVRCMSSEHIAITGFIKNLALS